MKIFVFPLPATLGRSIWNLLLAKTAHLRLNVIFPLQLALAVSVLNRIGNLAYCQKIEKQMTTLPANTLGSVLSDLLQTQNLHLVPWYMEHDLKHALLGYAMQACDEMRMQCFMWGNAGFTPFTTLVTLLFMIWTPEMWTDVRLHYCAGKRVKNLKAFRLEDVMHRDLEELRTEIGLNKAKDYLTCSKK